MNQDFKITRIYADHDGESHFDELQIPLEDAGIIGYLSQSIKVKDLSFRKVVETYEYDFHVAPHRQYIVLLDGQIEIETSLGEKRQFNAGEVICVEDTNGKGHRTKNLLPEIRSSIFIRF